MRLVNKPMPLCSPTSSCTARILAALQLQGQPTPSSSVLALPPLFLSPQLRTEWHLWLIAVVWYAIPPPAYVPFWWVLAGMGSCSWGWWDTAPSTRRHHTIAALHHHCILLGIEC